MSPVRSNPKQSHSPLEHFDLFEWCFEQTSAINTLNRLQRINNLQKHSAFSSNTSKLIINRFKHPVALTIQIHAERSFYNKPLLASWSCIQLNDYGNVQTCWKFGNDNWFKFVGIALPQAEPPENFQMTLKSSQPFSSFDNNSKYPIKIILVLLNDSWSERVFEPEPGFQRSGQVFEPKPGFLRGQNMTPGEILPGVQKSGQIFDSCPANKASWTEGGQGLLQDMDGAGVKAAGSGGRRSWNGDDGDIIRAGGGCGGRFGKGGVESAPGLLREGFCWILLGFEEKGEKTLGGGAHQGQSGWSKTTGAMDL
ncbi:hypothetical protein BY996DRAFT_6593182 [Phakopsora pachyrhizi]|nr:hypothetical protein BY996DRAFT_6593182 [Phakopsora pachyrhizi]